MPPTQQTKIIEKYHLDCYELELKAFSSLFLNIYSFYFRWR